MTRAQPITAAEDLGIGTRAGYYDSAGAMRDLIQNHMLQLLCHVAMEPPVNFSADEVRNEKVKVLHAVPEPSPDDIPNIAVRAQYTAGTVGGEDVVGYREEEGVPAASHTETFAAIRIEVDDGAGRRFLLPAHRQAPGAQGDRDRHHAEARAVSRLHAGGLGRRQAQPAHPHAAAERGHLPPARREIPGTRMRITPVNMEFLYGTTFLSQSPEAYERLILDAMRGDATLFTRNDEVEAQWRIIDPVVHAWAESGEGVAEYVAGSQGPAEAHRLLEGDDVWRSV